MAAPAPKYVIKPHRPLRRIAALAAVAIGSAIIVGLALDAGQWRYILTRQANNDFRVQNHDLRGENDTLRAEIAKLAKGREIELEARLQLQKQISDLHAEIAELHQEIDFYQGIIAAVDVQAGPRVEGVRMFRFDDKGRYQFRIVLTHVSENDAYIEGRIAAKLQGRLDGDMTSVDLGDLLETDSDAIDFRFKHFRRVEGIIRLPDRFEPRLVQVELLDKAGKKRLFESSYSWSEVLN